MGAILDIISSYVFKAAMIGIILATSISLNDVMLKKAQSTNLEKSMNVSLSVLDWDFRNIGYNYSAGSKIAIATASSFKYYGDIDNNGSIDSVQWQFSSSFVTIADSSVRRYAVSRRLNNGAYYTVMRRLRNWEIKYLNASGTETAVTTDIRSVRVRVTAESLFIVNDSLLTATRQITIFPPNLAF